MSGKRKWAMVVPQEDQQDVRTLGLSAAVEEVRWLVKMFPELKDYFGMTKTGRVRLAYVLTDGAAGPAKEE